jgi:hypothetical protein
MPPPGEGDRLPEGDDLGQDGPASSEVGSLGIVGAQRDRQIVCRPRLVVAPGPHEELGPDGRQSV